MAAPRGISQPPTSFIGSQCQGIHHAPLNTYKHKTIKQRNHTTTAPHTKHTRTETRTHSPCGTDARNHYPRIKHHTPPPSGATIRPPETNRADTPHHHPPQKRGQAAGARAAGLLSQSPIACLAAPRRPSSKPNAVMFAVLLMHPTRRHYSTRVPHGTHPPNGGASRGAP